MPGATILNGNSFDFLDRAQGCDLILVDCPQGIYGSKEDYCEHFEFLPKLLAQMNSDFVLFFNVTEPYRNPDHAASRSDNYGMSDFDRWIARREAFYG